MFFSYYTSVFIYTDQIHVEVHWLYSIRVICYVLSYFPTDRVCWDFILFEGGLSFLLSPSACSKKEPLIIGGFFVLFWVFSYILKCFEVTVFVIWRYTNTNRIELNMSIWAQDVGSRSTGKSTMTESRLLLCKESGMLKLNTLSFFCVFYCSWTWTCLVVSGDISSLKSGIAIRVSGGL